MIRLENLEVMDRAGLIEAWSKSFGRTAPKGLSQSMLRRFLAFELQSQRSGGLSRQIKATLVRKGTKPMKQTSSKLKPGGRLIREWNGVTHVVDVTEVGFAWRGKTWRSLSVIAREITGAHWSGPRFFGLTRTSS